MMYHFIFGFFGVSSATAAVVAVVWPDGCSSALLVSGLISSSAILSTLAMRQLAQRLIERVLQEQVNQPEIACEQEHGDDDHRRRALNLFTAGRSDLLHFSAHVAVKTLGALWPCL